MIYSACSWVSGRVTDTKGPTVVIAFGGVFLGCGIMATSQFGRRHVGAIGGFLFAGAGVLGAWGPMIAGYLRDTTGSYHLAFTYAVVTSVVSLLLFAVTPQPPPYPTT